MYTRCPECDSTHVVNAAHLAQSRGIVKCGRCGCKFDALTCLFDEWPHLGDRPPAAGSRYRPPTLGHADDLAAPFGPATVHHIRDTGRTFAWGAVVFLLALLTVAHAAWAFRYDLARDPRARDVLLALEWLQPEPDAVQAQPGLIQVVSRDLHSHPTRAGLLVLSATFVNRAAAPQPWPVLELSLLDLDGRAVARRSFLPFEYLAGGGRPARPIAPDAHVPVFLEFASPGPEAVGFEIGFH